jgi:16S rRNA (cytidine1402-2'-O)-methyltransferase
VKALTLLQELLPGRAVAVAREMTKMHEEVRRGTAAELAAHFAVHAPKGEVTLVIEPAKSDP